MSKKNRGNPVFSVNMLGGEEQRKGDFRNGATAL